MEEGGYVKKFKTIKNSFSTIKAKITNTMTEDAYMIKMLEEGIEEFEKDNTTISLEEWREELIKEYNISL